MRDSNRPRPAREPGSRREARVAEPREIVIAHDPAAGAVTAVKNALVQFSLNQLKEHGHYERYAELMDPQILEDLLARMGPGWIPVDLVLAHYDACERLQLSEEQRSQLGARIGDRLQETTLVHAAKRNRSPEFDLWNAVHATYRMWGRLYQGGSVQVVKLGPKTKLLELRGFPMNRYAYFRQAQLAAIASAYSALGARISGMSVESFDADGGAATIRVSWL